ncbi:MAG: phosphatase PAP2 family protein [Acidobacteriaceae bacterium]
MKPLLMIFSVIVLNAGFVMMAPHNPYCFTTAAGSLFLMGASLRQHDMNLYYFSVFFAMSQVTVGLGNAVVSMIRPGNIDPAMMRFDHGISMGIYHWTTAHVVARVIAVLLYVSLPLFMAIVIGVPNERRDEMVAALVISTVVAPFIFLIFPAAGPAYLNKPRAAHNCLPSLHMAWALICAMRVPKWLLPASIAFAAGTAYATLAMGEHYVVDLVAAAIYTVAIFKVVPVFMPALAAQRAQPVAAAPVNEFQ